MQERKNGGAMYLYELGLPIGASQLLRGYRHARGLGLKDRIVSLWYLCTVQYIPWGPVAMLSIGNQWCGLI